METEQQRRWVCPDCTPQHECARCADVAREHLMMLSEYSWCGMLKQGWERCGCWQCRCYQMHTWRIRRCGVCGYEITLQ